MTNNIEQRLDDVNWQDYDEVISFYEDNKLYYNNYLAQSNTDKLISIAWVKLAYCYALIQKNRYSQTTILLEHVEHLIEQLHKDNVPEYNKIYERYLFNKGLALGRQKKYDKSQLCFNELVELDPQNELYREWQESNKIGIIYKKTSIVGWIAFGLLMFDFILNINSKNNSDFRLQSLLIFIMVISFSIPFIWRLYNKIQ